MLDAGFTDDTHSLLGNSNSSRFRVVVWVGVRFEVGRSGVMRSGTVVCAA